MPLYFPRIACILFLACILVFSFAAKGYAVQLSQAELEFVQLVNQVRTDPLPVTHEMGRSFDELADCGMLLGGMEPLEVNDPLCRAAQEKAEEILTLDYYSHVSPDGLTPAERLTEYGYRVFDSAQSLAVISFRNYMRPERAWKLLLQNILADETGKGQIRKLLNPVFKDLGVSMQSGEMTFGNRKTAVYIMVINVAISEEQAIESALWKQINTARQNPAQAFTRAGIDVEEVEKSLEAISWEGYGKLQPLARDDDLEQLAVEKLHEASSSEDVGLPVRDRADDEKADTSFSYVSQKLRFGHAALDLEPGGSCWKKAEAILASLVEQEALSAEGPQHILHPEIQTIGLKVDIRDHVPSEGANTSETAIMLAAKSQKESTHISGGVYAWQYIDEAKEQIEAFGLAGMYVELENLATGHKVDGAWTDVMGQYQLEAGRADEEHYSLNLRNAYGTKMTGRAVKSRPEGQRANFWTPLHNREIDDNNFSEQNFIWWE